MMQNKPLASLKQKIAIAFYLVVVMTTSIGVIAIVLSQGLKFKVDHLVSHEMAKVTMALNLSKDAQKLQTITAQLDSASRSNVSLYDAEKHQLLTTLESSWQQLLNDSRELASLKLSLAFQQELEQHIDKQLHYSQQMNLIYDLTDRAQTSHRQALNIRANLVNIQNSFAKNLTGRLQSIDKETLIALKQTKIKAVEKNLNTHEELASFLHIGEQLFAQLAQLSSNKIVPEINQVQRNTMRLYLTMKNAFAPEHHLYLFASNWLSLIQENIVGEHNIFQLSRDAKKSHNIASSHLSYQAKAAQDISTFAQELVTQVELHIEASRKRLKADSTSFVVLVFCAGIIYAFFVWLTNWHFISKGIIKPVIETSNAMNAIANEQLNTPLPKADNLELQQMMSSLETLKSYAAQVKAVSEIDGLTGVYNRRYFDQHLDIQLEYAKKLHTPLSLIILDIDKFKQYNDKYGHIAGDKCLKRVTNAVRSQLHRPADILARYGGDEFVILLPNTPAADAGPD